MYDPLMYQVLPSASTGAPPSLPPPICTVKVKNYVTLVLGSVYDCLSWKTEFHSFLVMPKLEGMLDGSIRHPSALIILSSGIQESNPAYSLWVRVDQLVRAWLFATLSKDTLP